MPSLPPPAGSLESHLAEQLSSCPDGFLAGYEVSPARVDLRRRVVSCTVLLHVDDRHSMKALYTGSWEQVGVPRPIGTITHRITPLGNGQVWRGELASPLTIFEVVVKKELGR